MTLITGHRGARNLWPENSLTGFRNAITLGVDAIEFDVHLTRSGELAFEQPIVANMPTEAHRTAIFRQINKNVPYQHHDALELPGGQIVLLTQLREGQIATVLQLPAQPRTHEEAVQQTRAAYAG